MGYSNSTYPRVRGLSEAIKELHTADPDSGFTLHALRQAVNRGDIPCIRCGRRILVNMESVWEYLNGSFDEESVAVGQRKILPIASGRF